MGERKKAAVTFLGQQGIEEKPHRFPVGEVQVKWQLLIGLTTPIGSSPRIEERDKTGDISPLGSLLRSALWENQGRRVRSYLKQSEERY